MKALLPDEKDPSSSRTGESQGSLKMVSTPKRFLILSTLLLTLFPLAGATGYLAYSAFTEKSRYEKAPSYVHPDDHQGEMIRMMGVFKGDLLSPKEYPEIVDALWFRVVSERRTHPDAPWHRDSTAPLVVERVTHGSIGPVKIEIGLLSKISLPLQRIEKNLSPFHRLALEFKTVSADEPILAIGYLKEGTLKDGMFERLLVFLPKDEPEVLSTIGRKRYHKVFFLGGITLVFLGLMVVMIPPLRRGLRS